MIQQDAKFIWYDNDGQGRNLYGLFRKTFDITGVIKEASLNIFADSAYQLFINGKFVEFGPVRFDPKYPLYDIHEIHEYLKPGENVIAVIVNYFGCKTYKSITNRAGMKAWGLIKTDNEMIDLSTYKSSWKCKKPLSYSKYVPKMSFALNESELYNQIIEEDGWKEVCYDDSNWNLSTELLKQDSWGELSPRYLPYMSVKEIDIPVMYQIVPLKECIELHSFSVPIKHFYEDDREEYSDFVAFCTWIYSNKDQEINVGVFWGENWLNGVEISRGVDSLNESMRINQFWNLKKGWNYLFGKVNAYSDILEQYFAVPKEKGIVFSAEKNIDCKYSFKRTPILRTELYNKYIKSKPIPYLITETLDEIGGWIYINKSDEAQSPCRETSWDEYEQCIENLIPNNLKKHVFKINKYPKGFAIIIDLEYTHLFFPYISIEGVEGATVDVTYTEHLNMDNLHFYHMHNYSIGDRILCKKDIIEWMPVQPRGGRYIKITIRNISNDIKFNFIKLLSAGYPVKLKGYFHSSDKVLNAIWEMGRLTQEVNMEDAYVDCVSRERGMYARDTIIQYNNNLVTFGDYKLMKRCMQLYAQSPDETGKFRAVYPNSGDYTISDFALNLVEGYYNYYQNTGDIEIIRRCWPEILHNLEWFNKLADKREDMLLDSEWHLKNGIKAHYGGFHGDQNISKGYMDNTGIHCVFSCTYLIALQNAAKLAEALSDVTTLKSLNNRIKILSNSILEKFWDEEKGCFSDNLERTTHSVHASLFAVRAGVVSDEFLNKLKKHVTNDLKSIFVNGYDPNDGVYVSPSFAFYIFDGLYKAGLFETAENMMKQGWGWMLAKGFKTCSEYFETKNSLCHAWSASPIYYLSKNILGINFPNAPDLNLVEISVHTHYVTQVEGAYPHPKGIIKVKWHMENEKRVFDLLEVPKGVEVNIVE